MRVLPGSQLKLVRVWQLFNPNSTANQTPKSPPSSPPPSLPRPEVFLNVQNFCSIFFLYVGILNYLRIWNSVFLLANSVPAVKRRCGPFRQIMCAWYKLIKKHSLLQEKHRKELLFSWRNCTKTLLFLVLRDLLVVYGTGLRTRIPV